MEQVSGPVVAVALVLSAVFVPCAFITGITGQFFRQFALTIAVSTIISAFNSLTLSPALAALLLQPNGAKKDVVGRVLDYALGWFFRLFNFGFRHGTSAYTGIVRTALRGSVIVLALYGGLLALTWWEFGRLPTGYIPAQDKGYLLIPIQLPDSASLERTNEVVDHIDRICKETPGVAHTISSSGFSFTLGAYGSNFANFFVMLDDFSARRGAGLYSDEIIAKLRRRIAAEVPEATVLVLGPPAVNGLGNAGGFKFAVEDRGDLGLEELGKQADRLIRAANKKPTAADPTGTPGLTGMFTVFRANSPQLFVDVNREQCFSLGVRLSDVFDTLQIYLGSLYVNDFNKFGRTWQVNVQADSHYRDQVEDVKRLKVRNAQGGMVPLGTLCTVRLKNGPLLVGRYNMYPAAAVFGSAAPGYSSGQAVQILEDLARKELPPRTMAIEWTEITLIQNDAAKDPGNRLVFPLTVLFVFLVLAAQYESWSLPLAVILVVPMCILGSLVGVDVSHSDVNVFTQIGFVVLVGLASKNAILIVVFARARRPAGATTADATLEACRLRLRPILMTSFAFILGVVPLMLAKGAGAEMRQVLGTAVFSGMLGVTLFGIFLTPVFFYVIDRVTGGLLSVSPLLRWLNFVSLELLTLEPIWRAIRRPNPADPPTDLPPAEVIEELFGHAGGPRNGQPPAAGAEAPPPGNGTALSAEKGGDPQGALPPGGAPTGPENPNKEHPA